MLAELQLCPGAADAVHGNARDLAIVPTHVHHEAVACADAGDFTARCPGFGQGRSSSIEPGREYSSISSMAVGVPKLASIWNMPVVDVIW